MYGEERVFYCCFIPQPGQNAAPLVGVPQRGHVGSELMGRPHPGQNAAPGGTIVRHVGHCCGIPSPVSGVPQLTQRAAPLGLSVPQRGHGL